MPNRRLNQILESAYRNNDVQLAYDTYYQWQISQCYFPIRQRVYDAHTMTERVITLPCGRCYHCTESKINEWCTRMYAHAEDFKNVYFVTLTYRSITNLSVEVNSLLLQKLKQAVWHYDSLNSTKHVSWNPCLLVKDHYQRFLKRLRKNTGLSDITYVMSGEYGHDYGRPHFHMVLFTNGTLTKRDIVRAWSVCLWRDYSGKWSFRRNQRNNGTAYDFPIGRVDFNDLVQNGTFNTTAKIRVDGTYMNAANCFAYVCKYVCKRDEANMNRVRLAYRNLFQKQSFVKIYDKEVPFYIAKQYLQEHGYTFEQAVQVHSHLKRLTYEKILFSPSQTTLVPDRQVFKTLYGQKVLVDFFPQVYYDFSSTFSPFCEFSRGTPIGSIYARRNIQEFTQGVFTKPILQNSGFVVPSYFRTKAANYLYRLRQPKRTLKGVSFNLGPMPDLYRRLSCSLETGVSLPEHIVSSDGVFRPDEIIQHTSRTYYDAYTRERIVLADYTAQYYKYNRHSRDYECTRRVPLSDWIKSCCVSMQQEFERHSAALEKSRENDRLRERAQLLLQDMCGDYCDLRDRFVSRVTSEREHLQREYHAAHQSVE